MYKQLSMMFLMHISTGFILSAAEKKGLSLIVCNKTFSHMELVFAKERVDEDGKIQLYEDRVQIARAGGQADLKIVTPNLIARFVECGKKSRCTLPKDYLIDAGTIDNGRLEFHLCLTTEYALKPNAPCLLAPEAYGGAQVSVYNAHSLFDLSEFPLEDIIDPTTGKRRIVMFLESMSR